MSGRDREQDNPATVGRDNGLHLALESDEFVAGVHYPHPFSELVIALCARARRSICLLSPRLDRDVFDNDELAATLRTLAREGRQTRVRILIGDSRALVGRRHRLLQLARRLPSSVELQTLEDHPEWDGETVVIRDADGVLYKPGDSDHEGFYEPDSRASTRRHLDLFDELWRHSAADVELRSLTL